MEKESIKVLSECSDIQLKKSKDYQNPNSRIKQADYYPRGVMSIMELINTKTIRLWSLIEAMENDPSYEPNFESIEDSLKDLITLLGVSNKPSLLGSSPNHVKIVLNASSASLSETLFASNILSSGSLTNFIAPFYTVNTHF